MGAETPRLFTYRNGFELLFVPYRAAPVLALDLWVRAGGAHEGPGQAGIAHLLEHMLFKGTARRGPGAMAREVEAVGGEINAYTTFDHTVYTVAVASRFLDLGLDVLADAVFHPRLDPRELEREKGVVLEEIRRGRDLPQHYLSRLLFSQAFSVHPYGQPVLGSEESVTPFGPRDCRAFLRRWYRPGNMTLVVVGQASPEDLAHRVDRFFGGASSRPRPRRPARPREPRRRSFRGKMEARDVSETYLELAFPGPAASHPDLPALDILTTILGQGEASRLQHRVKLDRNLVRSVGAGAYCPSDPGIVYVGAVADPGRVGAAYEAICEEVFRLRHEPVGARELQRAVENVEADFVYQKETVQGQAQKAGFFHVVLGDLAAEERYLAALRGVDAAAVRAVARRHLRADRGVLALLHPHGSPPPWDVAEAGRVAGGLEGRARRTLPGRTGRQAGVVRRVLPNGARVVVKRNPEVPIVAVRAAFLGGVRREPAALSGAFHLLAGTAVRGTRSRSALEVAHGMDAISGQVEGFSGRNSFGVKAEFLSRYLEDGLELFADVLCLPALPEAEVDKVREDALSAIRLRRDSPGSLAFRLFEETLYGDHPSGRDVLGRPDTLVDLSGADLRRLFEAAARPENLAVAVAGDVDPDEVEAFFLHALELLVPRGELPAAPAPPRFPEEPAVREVASSAEQAHVVVGFPGTRLDSPDRFALRVLNGVLAGQGGRFFRRLRDELGLAYAVTSACVEGLDPGYLAGYVATAPGNAGAAREELLAEFDRLVRGDVEAGEVEEARQKLVGGFEIALQENAFQAAQMALDEIYGTGCRAFQTYARSVLAVTVEEVVAAARRYLRTPVSLVLTP